MVAPIPAGLRTGLALVLSLALAGCLPNGKADVRKPAKDAQVTPASFQAPEGTIPIAGNDSGKVLGPRRTRLSLAIVSRPPGDPAVGAAVWGVADEQAVPAEARALLEANGLRVGLLRGSLPVEVSAALNAEPPAKKTDVIQVDQPDGEPTYVDLAAARAKVTMLLVRDGRAIGKDYDDAKGLVRVVADRDDSAGSIRLRLVPEIRFGPVQHGFDAAPTSSQFQPKEFVVRDGQAKEAFLDLATTVAVRPGQTLVVGARGDAPRGLGGFLFHGTEPDSDRPAQRLLLIWAQPGTALARPDASQGGRGFKMFQARDAAPSHP